MSEGDGTRVDGNKEVMAVMRLTEWEVVGIALSMYLVILMGSKRGSTYQLNGESVTALIESARDKLMDALKPIGVAVGIELGDGAATIIRQPEEEVKQ